MEAISLNDFRKNDNIVKVCYNTNEPIFLTQDGENDMVLMSAKTFEEYELYNKVMEGYLEVNSKDCIDGKQFAKELKMKYDL